MLTFLQSNDSNNKTDQTCIECANRVSIENDFIGFYYNNSYFSIRSSDDLFGVSWIGENGVTSYESCVTECD